MRKRHGAATRIQSLGRSYLVRKLVLPSLLEARRLSELESSRVALVESMLGLHRNIHTLAYVPADQHRAATRIQAWWRAMLAQRVVQILLIRNHFVKRFEKFTRKATDIQARVRGIQARRQCFLLRMQ